MELEVDAVEGREIGRDCTRDLESALGIDENCNKVESSASTKRFELRAQTDRGVREVVLNLRSGRKDAGKLGNKEIEE